MSAEKQSLSHKVANYPEYMTIGEIERYLALGEEPGMHIGRIQEVIKEEQMETAKPCLCCGELTVRASQICSQCLEKLIHEEEAGQKRLAAAVPKTGDELLAQAISLLEPMLADVEPEQAEQLTLVIDTLNLVRGVREERNG